MPNVNVSTARLGFSSAAASLLVAMLAPILGAIADQGGVRKRLLIGFAYLRGADARSPFFVGKGQWAWAVFIYVLGSIGFAGAIVLYNALLPQVAGEDRVDRVSSFGYALGYLGGGLLFLLDVCMTLMPLRFGLADSSEAVRFAFLTVALWWGGFTLFTICWVPEKGGGGGM